MSEIPWEFVETIDKWLDENVGILYLNEDNVPNLAQDWARIGKVQEELGEAIKEWIAATGQNPRKGYDDTARPRLLQELADTAWTAILAIQHFTKDSIETREILREKINVIYRRMARGETSTSTNSIVPKGTRIG